MASTLQKFAGDTDTPSLTSPQPAVQNLGPCPLKGREPAAGVQLHMRLLGRSAPAVSPVSQLLACTERLLGDQHRMVHLALMSHDPDNSCAPGSLVACWWARQSQAHLWQRRGVGGGVDFRVEENFRPQEALIPHVACEFCTSLVVETLEQLDVLAGLMVVLVKFLHQHKAAN